MAGNINPTKAQRAIGTALVMELYYKQLVERGLPDPVIDTMLIDYHRVLISRPDPTVNVSIDGGASSFNSVNTEAISKAMTEALRRVL